MFKTFCLWKQLQTRKTTGTPDGAHKLTNLNYTQGNGSN